MTNIGMLPSSAYERAIEWTRMHMLEEFDIEASRVSPGKSGSPWYFYDRDGELCSKIPDDLMQRLARVFFIWEFNGEQS